MIGIRWKDMEGGAAEDGTRKEGLASAASRHISTENKRQKKKRQYCFISNDNMTFHIIQKSQDLQLKGGALL